MTMAGSENILAHNSDLTSGPELSQEFENADKRWLEGKGQQSETKNPMLISAVLETFFSVCDLTDLRRFRLVCKLWHNLSLGRWREDMVLTIAFDTYFEDRRHTNKRNRLYWKKVDILHESQYFVRKPYRKFRLVNWEFPSNKANSLYLRERKRILNTFWDNCGPWMRELELVEPAIQSSESFKEILLAKCANVVTLKLNKIDIFSFSSDKMEEVTTQPNLTSLLIYLSVESWETRDAYEGDYLIPWFELFVAFPNLEELVWHDFEDKLCRFLITDWKMLTNDKRHVGRKLKIKCFDVNRNIYVTSPEILCKFLKHPDFIIQNLDIDMDEVNSHIDGVLVIPVPISKAVRRHRKTFEELNVSTQYYITQDIVTVSLPSLRKLTLSSVVVPNFHFLHHTPNLEELTMFSDGDLRGLMRRTNPRRMDYIVLQKLSYLHVGMDVKGCESIIKIFAKCMPNLAVLEYPLNRKSIRAICAYLSGLRKLVDLDEVGKLVDESITGVVAGQGRLPNITDLKYLRDFRTPSSSLSDKSVWNGFLECQNLTSVGITFHERTSSDAFFAMLKRFGTGIRWRKCDIQEKKDFNEELKVKEQIMSKEYGIGFRL